MSSHFGRRVTGLGALRIFVLIGFALFCVIPLVWLLLAPTKTDAQMLSDFPLSFGSLDRVWLAWTHLANYNDGAIFGWMRNSVIYSISTVVLAVTTSVLAGYALALIPFRGRNVLLTTTLLAMILPGAALVLPLFLEINAAGLVNTALSVILPSAFFPFGVYLSFVYFSTSIPTEVLEAALIDGCSRFQSFRLIVLPLGRPLLALLAFFSFIASWTNYFLPFVMLSDDTTYNLPVGLGILINSTPALHPANGGSLLPITRSEATLAGLLVVVPVALLFIFFQRFLVRGILEGSVKS